MTAGVVIGRRRNRECGGMGAHMPAVGNESERAEQRAASDFGDHHGEGQTNDQPCASRVFLVLLTKESVRMGQTIE